MKSKAVLNIKITPVNNVGSGIKPLKTVFAEFM
jgi:hypothetical protein